MSFRATYLGHATVEIEAGGETIITDPIFSRRIFFIKRLQPLPIDPSKIRQPAAIFVSHAHYDHLDLASFKYFSMKIPIVLPVGLGKLVRKFLKNPIIELKTDSTEEILPNLKVTAFRVKHTGCRMLPIHYLQCNGYLIEFYGKRIFFPGDTAYRSDFSKLAPVDIALLPIACYKPEWIMKNRHMNPIEAVQVFEEIGAKTMVPIHWGTFKLSSEPIDEPIEWLKRVAKEKSLETKIKILQPGESYTAFPQLTAIPSVVKA